MQLSICLIAKNAEYLRRCLDSVKFAEEIIVVDTGDGDVTAIAKEYGAKTGNFTWCDDFSAARNASLDMATQPWIFVIDADETLPESAIPEIEACIKSSVKAFTIVTRNYTKSPACCNWKPLGSEDELAKSMDYVGWYPSYKVRLLRNHCGLRFSGKIHELIKSHSAVVANFYVQHFSENVEVKQDYYLRLGQMKIEDSPTDAHAHFELGLQLAHMQRFEESIKYFEKTIELDPKFGDIYYGNSYFEIASIYSAVYKNFNKAIEYFKKSLWLHPNHGSSYFNLGHLYAQMNDFARAEENYRKCLEFTPEFSVAYHNLSHALLEQKKYFQALISAKTAVSMNKNLLMSNNNIMMANYHLGRKEDAIKVAEEVWKEHKYATIIFSLAQLFIQDKDTENAIKYLKILLEHDPKQSYVYNNISSIYMQQEDFATAEVYLNQAIENAGRTFDTISNFALLKIKQKKEASDLAKEAHGLASEEQKQHIINIGQSIGITFDEEKEPYILASILANENADDLHKTLIQMNMLSKNVLIFGKTSIEGFNVIKTEDYEEKLKEEIQLRNPDLVVKLNAGEVFEESLFLEMNSIIDSKSSYFSQIEHRLGNYYYDGMSTRSVIDCPKSSITSETQSKLLVFENEMPDNAVLKLDKQKTIDYNRKIVIFVPPTEGDVKKCLTALYNNTDYPYSVIVGCYQKDEERKNIVMSFINKGMHVYYVVVKDYGLDVAKDFASKIAYDYFAIVDPHVSVTEKWASNMVHALQFAGIGSVCPRMNEASNKQRFLYHGPDYYASDFADRIYFDYRQSIQRIDSYEKSCVIFDKKYLELLKTADIGNRTSCLALDTFVYNAKPCKNDNCSSAKIVFGLARGPIKGELPAASVNLYYDEKEIIINLEHQFVTMFDHISLETNNSVYAQNLWQIVIKINDGELKKFSFENRENGLSFIRKFVKDSFSGVASNSQEEVSYRKDIRNESMVLAKND